MRRLLRDQSGASTVEAALVLPLLFMALIGVVQFALVHHAQTVAETAAIEGARLAAAEGYSLQDGASRTRDVLEAGLGATGAAFAVDVEASDEVVITRASGEYRLFIPWVTSLSVPVEAQAEVWREGFRGGP